MYFFGRKPSEGKVHRRETEVDLERMRGAFAKAEKREDAKKNSSFRAKIFQALI